jgi:anti-sigma regulatory factor (Ser/Thr protein kinase)
MSTAVEQLDLGDHVVQFYERDDDLVASVGRYLDAAVRAGEVAIVIATRAHRRRFSEALEARGVDLGNARASGELVELDAAETLDRFMVGGKPDPDAFAVVVGGLVRSAAEGGRRVRAYGEMVALLWDDGLVTAAIELEDLWNRLAKRVAFSLFCAYPTTSVTAGEHVDAFADICRCHSALVPDDVPAAARRFDASRRSPRAARRFVADVLRSWGRGDLIEAANFVVSELATNALLHARCGYAVSVWRRADTVRIAVRDDSSEAPVRRRASADATGGRGLTIVARFARDWGHESFDDGKLVWADLPR